MLKLLLDSATDMLTVGVVTELTEKMSKSVGRYFPADHNQSELMIPEIQQLFEATGNRLEDITDIYVTQGPGSYTGLRVALTISKVLALVIPTIKIHPISTLEALGAEVNDKPYISVIDARSNRSYVGVYYRHKCLFEDQVIENDKLMELIKMNPDYNIVSKAKFLKGKAKEPNLLDGLRYLSNFVTETADIMTLKPIYLKGDNENDML